MPLNRLVHQPRTAITVSRRRLVKPVAPEPASPMRRAALNRRDSLRPSPPLPRTAEATEVFASALTPKLPVYSTAAHTHTSSARRTPVVDPMAAPPCRHCCSTSSLLRRAAASPWTDASRTPVLRPRRRSDQARAPSASSSPTRHGLTLSGKGDPPSWSAARRVTSIIAAVATTHSPGRLCGLGLLGRRPTAGSLVCFAKTPLQANQTAVAPRPRLPPFGLASAVRLGRRIAPRRAAVKDRPTPLDRHGHSPHRSGGCRVAPASLHLRVNAVGLRSLCCGSFSPQRMCDSDSTPGHWPV